MIPRLRTTGLSNWYGLFRWVVATHILDGAQDPQWTILTLLAREHTSEQECNDLMASGAWSSTPNSRKPPKTFLAEPDRIIFADNKKCASFAYFLDFSKIYWRLKFSSEVLG